MHFCMHCSTFAMPLSLLLAILLGGIAHNVLGSWHMFLYVAYMPHFNGLRG